MNLATELYRTQTDRWPKSGRHILAQVDDETIVVYQAYRPSIGRFAAQNGYFGGEFKFDRMSWIKPNFLWMMYRSDWGTKEEQETTLAIRMKRSGFDTLLREAVPTTFDPIHYASESEWRSALASSPVRSQWDPDHHPSGAKLERRALQLGIRGELLIRYAKEWIASIEDISEFVYQQRNFAHTGVCEFLVVPKEEVYVVADAAIAKKLGIEV